MRYTKNNTPKAMSCGVFLLYRKRCFLYGKNFRRDARDVRREAASHRIYFYEMMKHKEELFYGSKRSDSDVTGGKK